MNERLIPEQQEPDPQELDYFRTLKERHGLGDKLSSADLTYLRKYKQAYGRFVKADNPQNSKNLDHLFGRIYGTPDRHHNETSSSPLSETEHGESFQEDLQSYRILGAGKNTVTVGKTYRFIQYPDYEHDLSEIPENMRDFFNKPVIGKVTRILSYNRSGLIGYVIEIEPAPGEERVGYIYDDGSSGAGRLREVEEIPESS
ncbi:MAG: hypothetical protein AAB790_01605 [Patescibacteria group bacterium]